MFRNTMTLSAIIVLLATALTGCNNDNTSVFIEDEVIEVDDTGLDEELNDDTGLEDYNLILSMVYTTAWSAAVDFEVTPGQSVNFGAWTFKSINGEDIPVTHLSMNAFIDVNGDGIFNDMEQGITASNYFTNCTLRDSVSYALVMGPVDPENGRLFFADEFIVGGEYTTALNLFCDLSEEAEELEYAAFAFDIWTLTSGADVHEWLSHNVEYLDDGGVDPRLAAFVEN